MFVNRGMIEAAQGEGEVAGVMAHELAHVLLRHGTANATKAQGFQIGALAGAIAGAVIGGGLGQVISQGSQFGLGTWLMKYSRDYEKQADLLGAQIMARAGLRPARPGPHVRNHCEAGRRHAAAVAEQPPEPGQPHAVHQRRSAAAANRTAAQPTAASSRRGRASARCRRRGRWRRSKNPAARGTASARRRRWAASANRCRRRRDSTATQQGGELFQVQVPTNWQAVSSNNSVKFVPQNGYGEYRGQVTLTHGAEAGRRARVIARLEPGHASTDRRLRPQQRGHAARRAAATGPLVESRGHPHAAGWPVGAGRQRARRRLHDAAARTATCSTC